MSRSRKPESRCPECRMRLEFCICTDIAEFRKLHQPQTRVVVLMHHREERLTTNTAHLAALILPRCEVHIRGDQDAPLDASKILDANASPLLLYPSDDAQILTEELVAAQPRPVYLIVPDGSWRQASKVAKRESFLTGVPRVVLRADAPTRYRLRREPKVDGLATFEAIARAMGVVDGTPLRKDMEAVFEKMVERTLRSREGLLPNH